MNCNNCGSTAVFEADEYAERIEKLGIVLCTDCRNSELPQRTPTPTPLPQ